MQKTLLNWFNTCLVALALIAGLAHAETPEEKGLGIAKERKARNTGWGDTVAEARMILRNAQGEESVRRMRIKSLEVQGDGDKGLTIFDEPRDVAGTAFLNFSHATEPDEQWLYLPALKRVKRISSRNKSGPFMGSEFAYEDLSSFEVEKYTYRYLRDETVDGMDCFVVESTPVDKYSGYTRIITWVDKTHYRPIKVEFHDRKGSLLKTLTLKDYRQYEGKFWRAHHLSMINHQTGKSTELFTDKLQFRTGLTDADFNKATLKRAR